MGIQTLVDDQDKGTIIDFMTKRGYSYQDIRGLQSGHLDNSVLKNQAILRDELKDVAAQKELAGEYLSECKSSKNKNYLAARGIQEATYAPYQEHRLKAGSKAVFGLHQNVNSQGKGTLSSTITYQFSNDKEDSLESKKYFQKGLSRKLSVLNSRSQGREDYCHREPLRCFKPQTNTSGARKYDVPGYRR